jgi:hypothetical protein
MADVVRDGGTISAFPTGLRTQHLPDTCPERYRHISPVLTPQATVTQSSPSDTRIKEPLQRCNCISAPSAQTDRRRLVVRTAVPPRPALRNLNTRMSD